MLHHRAPSVVAAVGITALGLLLPGSGMLFTGRRRLGFTVLGIWFVLVAGLVWLALANPRSLLSVAVTPRQLLFVTIGAGLLMAAWVVVLAFTYHFVRPENPSRWHGIAGRVGVGILCLVVAAPLVVGMRYSLVQRDLVNTVFNDEASATRPSVDPDNPWAGTGRVNVLLLGGDGGVHREGIRTDSMIVASVDTNSGDTTLFSVPRNLMYVPFPEDSPLHEIYPNGFTGEGDDGEWMLNAVYRNVPKMHPGILGTSDNEGADALKQALTAALGIPVDYYVLVNLDGFEKIVDAMGGVTVNINQPIPIGGDTDKGIPPEDYLEPGPHRRLDGFEALWFSRGRYGLDDYNRMQRQRCMMKAIIDEADPLTLLREYKDLVEASKKILRTDIPQKMLPAFVNLALRVKDGRFDSVLFVRSGKFNPGDPDYEWMQQKVQTALNPDPESTDDTGKKKSADPVEPTDEPEDTPGPDEPTDPCAYHPVE